MLCTTIVEKLPKIMVEQGDSLLILSDGIRKCKHSWHWSYQGMDIWRSFDAQGFDKNNNNDDNG